MSQFTEKDRLTGEHLLAALDPLPGWQPTADSLKLGRTLHFADFVQAFGFMTQAALIAQERNHHPEWFNVWNRVEINLTTHTAGGITVADIALARAFDEIASRFEINCSVEADQSCGVCR